jgi:hypothetical protein
MNKIKIFLLSIYYICLSKYKNLFNKRYCGRCLYYKVLRDFRFCEYFICNIERGRYYYNCKGFKKNRRGVK